jgi:hypothetical protein
MSDETLAEPGAARFGNFINYYQFNPADKRVCHLPKSLLQTLVQQKEKTLADNSPILCLDVGCNTGVSSLFRGAKTPLRMPIYLMTINQNILKTTNA